MILLSHYDYFNDGKRIKNIINDIELIKFNEACFRHNETLIGYTAEYEEKIIHAYFTKSYIDRIKKEFKNYLKEIQEHIVLQFKQYEYNKEV